MNSLARPVLYRPDVTAEELIGVEPMAVTNPPLDPAPTLLLLCEQGAADALLTPLLDALAAAPAGPVGADFWRQSA